MAEGTITCPHCRKAFELSAAMRTDIERTLRQKVDADAEKVRRKLEAREKALADKAAEAKRDRANLDEMIADGVTAERGKLEKKLKEKAEKDAAAEAADRFTSLEEDLVKSRSKLKAAQKAELDLRKTKQALEEQKSEWEVEKQRTLDAARAEIQAKTRKTTEEEFRLKAAEKDKVIRDMKKQVDDLKRKAEQGSQQLQGEVQELELEDGLKAAFPRDTIEPVGKGVRGGDVLQRVVGPQGTVAGTILWESKRTKAWSEGWLPKLRDDQREAKAQVAALVTSTLPKDIDTFEERDGVWVSGMTCAIPMASVLRVGLIEVDAARRSSEGKQTKMEMVYQYLTGTDFRRRIEAIKEAFKSMKKDLDDEKSVFTKQWAKREKQIEKVIGSTVGMYGDLQGIAGASMPTIEGLEVRGLLEGPESE